jgi:hypothetical protein
MAISTYAELLTAIANWTDRSDLSSRASEFVSICEAKVNRKLRVRETQAEADVTLVAGTRTAALPSDFGEVRRVYLNTNPIKRLDFMSSLDYWDRYTGTNTGRPVVFTIEGSNLVFGPTPDSGYTAKLLYYRQLPALSSSAHGVFTSNPDLYLYGSLVAAEPFLKNDKRFTLWKTQFDEILMELEQQSSRAQGSMRMRDDSNPY